MGPNFFFLSFYSQHLCSYLHQFSAVECIKAEYFVQLCAGTAPSIAIWDEFSEQHQHHSTKKDHIIPNLMQILVGCELL